MYHRRGKRLFDIFFGTLLLSIFLPVMFLISICVILLMGRPVFFLQPRVGLAGRTFRIFKFRTMSDLRDERGNLAPDSLRLTPLGRFLRRWSLDELPTFIHVVMGQMSLVGPRPLIQEMQPEDQHLRTSVPPGVTGLAQVSGGNRLSLKKRFSLDEQYLKDSSFFSDLGILLRTPLAIIRQNSVPDTFSHTVSS